MLDTGVQKTHPFLQQSPGVPKVVSEACFSTATARAAQLEHGLRLGRAVHLRARRVPARHARAGIAAGKGTTFSGVARGAGLVAIQVFSRFDGPTDCGAGEDPCALSFDSDQLAGLERVFAIRNTFRSAR